MTDDLPAWSTCWTWAHDDSPPSKVHHILTIGGAKTHQKAEIAANTVNLVYWIGVRMDGSLAVVSLLVLACD